MRGLELKVDAAPAIELARERAERFRDAAAVAEPWPAADGPRYLCVGSLTERKNVLRLAAAVERLGTGSLVFLGDGPLRAGRRVQPGRGGPWVGRGDRCRAGAVRHQATAILGAELGVIAVDRAARGATHAHRGLTRKPGCAPPTWRDTAPRRPGRRSGG